MSAPARPRSVPLAEAKSLAALRAEELKRHRCECATCYVTEKGRRRDCPRAVEMDKALRKIRADIRHWFDPGPGDVTLFDL